MKHWFINLTMQLYLLQQIKAFRIRTIDCTIFGSVQTNPEKCPHGHVYPPFYHSLISKDKQKFHLPKQTDQKP